MYKTVGLNGQGEGWGRNRAFRPCSVTVWSVHEATELEVAIHGGQGVANAYFTVSADEARQIARELVNAAGDLDGHGWQCLDCGRWYEEMPAEGCWECEANVGPDAPDTWPASDPDDSPRIPAARS